MTDAYLASVDPKLDLVLERTIDVPVDLVWAAWTEPERLKQWFTPKPWETVDCRIDLRPGGRFETIMRSPEGKDFPNAGCYLEVVPQRRLVWTSALGPGFRPLAIESGGGASDLSCAALLFTGILTLAPDSNGTRYTATAIHADPDSSARHAAMGFHDGWGKALDQLVAFCKGEAF